MDFRRVPRVHGSGGARFHPRPDRGRAPCAAGPVPVGLVGDAGAGGQGVSGRGDRHPRAHEEPLPDTGRGDPQQPAVRPAGPGREGQCHVQALQGPATSLPRAPRPSPRSWPPPSSSSPSGTIPDTNPGEKGSLCATLGPVPAGPEGCSRGRWRSGPSKWRHTAAPEGRGQGAPRTCRCIETRAGMNMSSPFVVSGSTTHL